MNQPVIIIGGGGHAKVLVSILKRQEIEIIGVLDTNPTLNVRRILDIPILGDDRELKHYPASQVALINGIGSIRQPDLRKSIFERFKKLGYDFMTIVDQTAMVAPEVSLTEGVQVMAGAVIQPGSALGENTIINTHASIDHDCHIGAHVHIAPGVTLSGNVTVGDMTHIGTGATAIQGITIGEHCLVGAGSLLLKNVASNSIVLGSPAKVVQ